MIKKKIFKKINQERMLLVAGFILFALLVSLAIYAFSFLANNVFKAFSPEPAGNSELKFNLEEFDNLGL
ncbi:MAG: hypothetical protein HYS89_00360 [Candidatus Colwellbacteria bacterium]|nr:hypothetical protein [Candidatus Colwellbacteria bacterium]